MNGKVVVTVLVVAVLLLLVGAVALGSNQAATVSAPLDGNEVAGDGPHHPGWTPFPGGPNVPGWTQPNAAPGSPSLLLAANGPNPPGWTPWPGGPNQPGWATHPGQRGPV